MDLSTFFLGILKNNSWWDLVLQAINMKAVINAIYLYAISMYGLITILIQGIGTILLIIIYHIYQRRKKNQQSQKIIDSSKEMDVELEHFVTKKPNHELKKVLVEIDDRFYEDPFKPKPRIPSQQREEGYIPPKNA